MRCISCLSGRNWECVQNEQCNDNVVDLPGISDSSNDPDSTSLATDQEVREDGGGVLESDENEVKRPRTPVREVNTYKDDSALKDQQSTGRKRAAVMYPLDPEMDCEWARQKNCGGGSSPITGCISGKQQARHHGPDKNTLNNEAGNVHRICHNCHNRWHAKNDDGYVWGTVLDLHSPSSASFDELVISERMWQGTVLKKVKD